MTMQGGNRRLAKLKKHWRKATASERQAFSAWLGLEDGALPIACGRYLTPVAADRIRRELPRRNMDLEALNRALSLDDGDTAIGRALVEGMPLRLAVVAALERWLADGKPGDPVSGDQ